MFSKRMALLCALILGFSSITSVGLLPAFAVAAAGSKEGVASLKNGNNLQVQKQGGAEPMAPSNDGQVNSRLVTANTIFGFRLYSELTKAGANRNLFISPASIAMALAMTYNGAAGETRRAMQRVLALQDLTPDEVNAASARMRAMLEGAGPKVKLQIANSMWPNQGVQFQPDFLARTREAYRAEAHTLDFSSPSAAASINAWVKEQTKGKIDKIVDHIDPAAILCLVNAIYFKGAWAAKFDRAQTRVEDFTLAGGAKNRVPLMHQSGRYSYLENDIFQAVSLPYGDKGKSMYIFLPKPNSSLGAFHHSLTADAWQNWMTQFHKNEGHIAVPRFTVEYETNLKDLLSRMGMSVAFTGGADFSAMVKPPTKACISEVIHKAFAEVNEEGTEAAAVTAVVSMSPSAIVQSREKSFTMIVDRPFFFAIRDNQSDAILFMGSIAKPSDGTQNRG